MTTILIKKKDTAGVPAPGDLTNAAGGTEIAVNTATRRIYTKDAGGTVVELGTNASSSTIADLTVTNSTTLSYGTANQVQFLNASKLLVGSGNMTFNGTRLTVADLADSGLTSGRVTYASTGGALVDSANLTFDGTTLTANALTTTNAVTINGGTANGVAYLNGSKVLTTGSALTFDSSDRLIVGAGSAVFGSRIEVVANTSGEGIRVRGRALDGTGVISFGTNATATEYARIQSDSNSALIFGTGSSGSEQMRLTSTGLGIGTSSPSSKLHLYSALGTAQITQDAGTAFRIISNNGINYIQSGTALSSDSKAPLVFSSMFGVTEQMRLDSSGNLGLGVTPNTSSAAGKTFQIRNTLIEDNTNGYAIWRYNNYFDGGASDRYIANGAACSFQLAGNAFRWYQAASGTAGNAISFTQAMTLDASGNLGVGTTSPVYRLDVHATSPAFRLKTTAATTGFIADQNNSTLNVSLINYDNAALLFGTNANERARIDSSGNFGIGTSSPVSKLSINGTNSGSPNNTLTGSWLNVGSSLSSGFGMRQKSSDPGISGSGFPFQMAVIGGLPFEIYTADAQPLVFGTSATERARIDSSGNLRIGTTAHLIASNRRLTVFGQAGTELVVTGTTGEPCAEMWQQATSGNNVFTTFNTEASLTQRGSITYNRAGGLTVYNTTSDYRAKDVYGPVVDSGAVIDSVPVYMGKMKGATQERPMFIAHETPPYAHTGEKDAVDADDNPVYQQMDNSALVPVMWAEIQSLRQRLAAAGI